MWRRRSLRWREWWQRRVRQRRGRRRCGTAGSWTDEELLVPGALAERCGHTYSRFYREFPGNGWVHLAVHVTQHPAVHGVVVASEAGVPAVCVARACALQRNTCRLQDPGTGTADLSVEGVAHRATEELVERCHPLELTCLASQALLGRDKLSPHKPVLAGAHVLYSHLPRASAPTLPICIHSHRLHHAAEPHPNALALVCRNVHTALGACRAVVRLSPSVHGAVIAVPIAGCHPGHARTQLLMVNDFLSQRHCRQPGSVAKLTMVPEREQDLPNIGVLSFDLRSHVATWSGLVEGDRPGSEESVPSVPANVIYALPVAPFTRNACELEPRYARRGQCVAHQSVSPIKSVAPRKAGLCSKVA